MASPGGARRPGRSWQWRRGGAGVGLPNVCRTKFASCTGCSARRRYRPRFSRKRPNMPGGSKSSCGCRRRCRRTIPDEDRQRSSESLAPTSWSACKGGLEEDSAAVPRRATSVLPCRSQTDSQSDRAAIVTLYRAFHHQAASSPHRGTSLVADLAPEGAAWGKLHVIAVRGLAPSDQAGVLGGLT